MSLLSLQTQVEDLKKYVKDARTLPMLQRAMRSQELIDGIIDRTAVVLSSMVDEANRLAARIDADNESGIRTKAAILELLVGENSIKAEKIRSLLMGSDHAETN